MNVKIDYASITDNEPLKLRPKRADPDSEDDETENENNDDDTGNADDSSSEPSREGDDDVNDDIDEDDEQQSGNDTESDTVGDDENIDNENAERDDDDNAAYDSDDGTNRRGGRDDDEDTNDDDDDDDDHESINDIDDDADADDDDDDDAEELRYRKINQDFRRNYITETHPETNSHTEDEIHALAKVVRDKMGIIIDPLHRTIPILTKYEKTRILGIRTKQLNNGAEPFISSKLNITPDKIIDGYPIALKELEEKKLPFIIRRPLPGGGVEYWYLQDLEVL
jgi:DNA-directed RNA polymerase subunit K/omega